MALQEFLLPEETMMEIFSYLPLKEIRRLRCLCRFFNDLYEDPAFSLLRSNRAGTTGVFITNTGNDCVQYRSIDGDGELAAWPDSLSSTNCKKFNFLGCNYGIFVYEVVEDAVMKDLCLFNPATSSLSTIPHVLRGAGRLWYTDAVVVFKNASEYQLFYFRSRWLGRCIDIHVYSSKDGVWSSTTKTDVGHLFWNRNHRPILVGNRIYRVSDFCFFIKNNDPYITAVDVETLALKKLPWPLSSMELDQCDRVEIAEWGGVGSSPSLCIVQSKAAQHKFTIWVVEDLEKCTWRRCITVTVSCTAPTTKVPVPIKNFTILDGDKLVFLAGNVMHVYRLKDSQVTWQSEIRDFPGEWKILPYTVTFLPTSTN